MTCLYFGCQYAVNSILLLVQIDFILYIISHLIYLRTFQYRHTGEYNGHQYHMIKMRCGVAQNCHYTVLFEIIAQIRFIAMPDIQHPKCRHWS